MAHKAFVGGTAYNVIGGKSLVSGTTYNIKSGRTLIGGTGYSIGFGSGDSGSTGEPTAMLYSDGNFVFQHGSEVASGKTLTASYTGFEDVKYTSYSSVPWNSNITSIKNVSFNNEIKPISLAYWFYNAQNIKTFNWTNLNINTITNMVNAYYNCHRLTGSPVCGNNVTDMAYTYYNCYNLTGSPVCSEKVTNITRAYYFCYNLTGSPVCGNNVTNMAYTYYYCGNLIGSPVCGNKVTNMSGTYCACRNLIGSPVCGNKVTNMYNTYRDCTNLTGSPVCGNNVITMVYAYTNCRNLTGSPVCGNKVTNMAYTYSNCQNLNAGTFYFYAKNIVNARSCFYGKNNSRRYNIHVPANSTTLNTFIKNTSTASLVGANITWTNNGTCWYNTTYNIYIYANTSME